MLFILCLANILLSRPYVVTMEQIECSETSAYINQMPGNHPKEKKQHCYYIIEVEQGRLLGG